MECNEMKNNKSKIKEYNEKYSMVLNKTTRALDKLSKEYNNNCRMFSGIKDNDGTWNTATASESFRK